jgi:predicted nucleotide-binding protein (sugar kinase/HSP70/actin superfamily)
LIPLSLETGSKLIDDSLSNLYEYSCQRVFDYEALAPAAARRGEIGILRALNSYDDYPLWHVFFTSLGYRVVLSDASSRELYARGAETILSESACYPAKISNGHLINLVQKGVGKVFLPLVERGFSGRSNCTVLSQTPLVLKLNVEPLYAGSVGAIMPRLSYDNTEAMLEALVVALADEDDAPGREELAQALEKGLAAYDAFQDDIRRAGRVALERVRASGGRGIVLAGRPYHLDPEMHHGLPELLMSFGFSVFTAQSVACGGEVPKGRWANERWELPELLYRAADGASSVNQINRLKLLVSIAKMKAQVAQTESR